MSGVLPILYETQWASLRHKGIKTPFVVSKFPDPVDQTTQETKFPTTNHWESFQSQIENLSYVDANVHPWELESTQLYGEIEQIKGDDPPLNLSYTYGSSLSDIHVAIDHEINVANYRKTFQSQIENLSYADSNVRFWEPESTQLHGGIARTKEDIYGSFSHNTYRTLLSDIVHAHADANSNYRKTCQRQVENLDDVESDAVFPEHELVQLLDKAVKMYEDIRGSYLHSTIIVPQSDTDVVFTLTEVGTAITDFTQLHKYQIEKQTFEISEQFDILSQREDNWDERGSLKPTKLTLAHAREVIDAYINTVTSAGYQCNTPTISSDGDGDVTAAWYKGERQIHFQISEHEVDYFKVWGTNIDTEMEVDFLIPDNYLTLWEWLIDE